MRIRITLTPKTQKCSITLDYQYYLSAAIYKLIETSSPDYAAFLHDTGYSTANLQRRFKHFCFSQLFAKNSFVENERLIIRNGIVEWYVGMPIEESAKHFVAGLFEKQEIFIGSEDAKFLVEKVEVMDEPNWSQFMKFKTLSPITVSVAEEHNGKLNPVYLKADDARLTELLQLNLINRYVSLYEKQPNNTDLICKVDAEYIAKRGGADRVSKLVVIKKNTSEETKVRGFRCPITLKGSIELIKLAYSSGLGEKGSMGFGMLEVAMKEIR